MILRFVSLSYRDTSSLLSTGEGSGTHLPLGVAEDNSLCEGERVVQVTQCGKLPLLLLHRHKELLDALHTPHALIALSL